MPTERYTGPPATIGNLKQNGASGFIVFCHTEGCGGQKRFGFDDLGIGDDGQFPAIARDRSFRCDKCGARSTDIMPDWRYVGG